MDWTYRNPIVLNPRMLNVHKCEHNRTRSDRVSIAIEALVRTGLNSAMGAVLSQVQEGQDRVITYWSRQLDKAQ